MNNELDWENFAACCKHIEGINGEHGCTLEVTDGGLLVTSCQHAENDEDLKGFQEDNMEIITYKAPLDLIGEMVKQMEEEHADS